MMENGWEHCVCIVSTSETWTMWLYTTWNYVSWSAVIVLDFAERDDKQNKYEFEIKHCTINLQSLICWRNYEGVCIVLCARLDNK